MGERCSSVLGQLMLRHGPRARLRSAASLIALTAVCASVLLPASARAVVTVDPEFSGSYDATDLGSPTGVPDRLGGLTIKAGTTDRLLIGGHAVQESGAIYEVGVTRDGGGHIDGFSATPASVAVAAPWIDGGVSYGPGGVLFVPRWPHNELGQAKPGSTSMDKVINVAASPFSIAPALESVQFVPPDHPGAGSVKLTSFSNGQWYDASVTADGAGTYDLESVSPVSASDLSGGPAGIVYVPIGSALFTNPSILVSEYQMGSEGAGAVAAYETGPDGDPVPLSRRPFISGLTGAEGAAIDPLTGDFLFSTFGGGSKVVVVKGFVPPPPPDTEAPDVTIDGGPSGGATTTDSTPTFTFSSTDPTATFECDVFGESESSAALAEASADGACTSPYTTEPLAPGGYTFRVIASDEAGNDAETTATFTVESPPNGCDAGDESSCDVVVCETPPCTVTVSNDQTTGTVTTSSSSTPNVEIFAKINGGEAELTCPVPKNFSGADYSRDWLQFFALSSLGKKGSKTVTLTTLLTSTKSASELKKSTLACVGAPYRFSPRLNFPRKLVFGEYRAFVPDCKPHPSSPCRLRVDVTEVSPMTWRVALTVFMPAGKDGLDPRVRRR